MQCLSLCRPQLLLLTNHKKKILIYQNLLLTLHPNSDLLLVSPYSIANESNINVTRIKKIILKSSLTVVIIFTYCSQWLHVCETLSGNTSFHKTLQYSCKQTCFWKLSSLSALNSIIAFILRSSGILPGRPSRSLMRCTIRACILNK